jgi:putative FmdB family regulatory protein
MPTYEYKCPAGHTFEKFHPTMKNDHRRVKCPVCGKPAQRQISGGAGLVFKGSGFYINDYKRAGEAKDPQEPKETKEPKEPKEQAEHKATAKPAPEATPADSSKKKKDSGDK